MKKINSKGSFDRICGGLTAEFGKIFTAQLIKLSL